MEKQEDKNNIEVVIEQPIDESFVNNTAEIITETLPIIGPETVVKRKRGRPKKQIIQGMSKDSNNQQSTTSVDSAPKKLGRPVGAGTFKNGVIPERKIFLFVPRESIPEKDISRFLQLCDIWIQDLGPESLKDTDLEEIALYCRDRLYIDGLYKTFAEAETIDPNLVNQIEKMNKAMEVRKSNLGSRFIDRGGKRQEGMKMSFIDLFENYTENTDSFLKESDEKNKEIEKNKNRYTDSVKYMEGHLLNKKVNEEHD